MKSSTCVIFLLIVCASSAFGAVMMGFYNDPNHPDKCTITPSLILSPGDVVKNPNAKCGRIICGEAGMAQLQSCGVQVVAGCTMGDYVDASLPYPECCKREVIC